MPALGIGTNIEEHDLGLILENAVYNSRSATSRFGRTNFSLKMRRATGMSFQDSNKH